MRLGIFLLNCMVPLLASGFVLLVIEYGYVNILEWIAYQLRKEARRAHRLQIMHREQISDLEDRIG